jgi:RimJ/RimL family protein N-acetyltransferase
MVLTGAKVTMRAVEWDDLPSIVRWLNDKEVTEHLLASPLTTIEEQQRWLENSHFSENRPFSIIDDEGRLIGYCGIAQIDWSERRCSIWLIIGEKDAWNHGYGTDSIRTLIRYLVQELHINRIGLQVDALNTKAISVYRSCGFRTECVQRASRFKHGVYRDDLVMAMTRRDWDRLLGSMREE